MASDWMERMFAGKAGGSEEDGESSRPVWMDWADRMEKEDEEPEEADDAEQDPADGAGGSEMRATPVNPVTATDATEDGVAETEADAASDDGAEADAGAKAEADAGAKAEADSDVASSGSEDSTTAATVPDENGGPRSGGAPSPAEASASPEHSASSPPQAASSPSPAQAASSPSPAQAAATSTQATTSPAAATPTATRQDSGPVESISLTDELEELRGQAVHAARKDAEAGLPDPDADGTPESENQLRDWCEALFDRWQNHRRREHEEAVGDTEEFISQKLSRAGLFLDRFERLSNEIVRLKAKLATRRWEVNEELSGGGEGEGGTSGMGTRIYVTAISFLGLVEFFANAPVFSALLPRDPLTERQIRILAETSEGWLAGVQRVIAHIALRPDAALLAAGVVTFLCVLAHFFGHSLRDLVRKRDRKVRREAVASRSPLENVIPMVLTGIGLGLVLSVLYVSRVELGETGQRQYEQDMAKVEDLRREAGWLRSDGDLLLANQKTNQADDLAAAAEQMREYSRSMSGMSFPILLLNATLVLCAITAAYFHRSDGRRERFDETPFEEDRTGLIAQGDEVAETISGLLSEAGRGIRNLHARLREHPQDEWRSVVRELEAAVSLYRVENGRARGLDPRAIPAFQEPVELDLEPNGDAPPAGATREPEDYEQERRRLEERFHEARKHFNEVAMGD